MTEPSNWFVVSRRRIGRRNPRRATILDDKEIGAMCGLDDVDAITAELRRRGVRYHVSAGEIYANSPDVLATFD